MRHNGGVVAGAGADMYGVVPLLQLGVGEQFRVQRRLAVVEMPLWQDRDHVVEVKVSRIGARRRDIVALPLPLPSEDRPRSGAKEILAAHFGKRRLDPRVRDPGRGQYLSRISTAHQAQFRFPIHLQPPASQIPCIPMRVGGGSPDSTWAKKFLPAGVLSGVSRAHIVVVSNARPDALR